MKKLILFGSFGLMIWMISCYKDPSADTSYITHPYSLDLPHFFPIPEIPIDNPMTEEGVALGRKLYYDTRLSPDNSRACASCHVQSYGFCLPDQNVMPHVNLAYSSIFLWNGGKQMSFEKMMEFEVAEFFQSDLKNIRSDTVYHRMYYEAFGKPEVNMEFTTKALAQFMRTQMSSDSKFDRFLAHKAQLTQDEMTGFQIFNSEKGDCFHCHSLPLTSDYNLHNNGLDNVFIGISAGHYQISGNPADKGKFRTPTLRNTTLQNSFMHDGRYKTLEDVIEFYNSGVKSSPSLDPIMTKPGKKYGLQLSSHEKYCLKKFLETLTDTTFLNNPKLGQP